MAGCEEDLGLREELVEPFTLYGVLSPDLSFQSVRVYTLNPTPELAAARPEDIVFTSTDLETGERLVWNDSLVAGPRGQTDLIYWSPLEVEYGRTYRVEAMRKTDGAISYADARIPPQVTIRTEDVVRPEPQIAILRIIVEGERIRVLRPEITYEVIPEGERLSGSRSNVTIPHHSLGQPAEEGWVIPINIWLDRLQVQGSLIEGIRPFAYILNDVRVDMLVGDETWDPPFGRFDPELLANSNVLTNVQNGYGYVGGGYYTSGQLVPGCDLVNDAEYVCREDLLPQETDS